MDKEFAKAVNNCSQCQRELPESGTCFCDVSCESAYKLGMQEPAKLNDSFTHLDDIDFLSEYAELEENSKSLSFFLEKVHCVSCLRAIESSADSMSGVVSIRLNLSTSTAKVKVSDNGSFAQVARKLNSLGYTPHALRLGDNAKIRKQENRAFLTRIAVAGASSGNIMLLAIAQYAGATGVMAQYFRWLSFALFLPVIVYSAMPFYKNAWSAIKQLKISIDLPIVFGILVGAIVSSINLFTGHDEVYFDSLSALVFLLLSTRYWLKRAQQSSLDASQLLCVLTPPTAKVWNSEKSIYEECRVEKLKSGDLVQVFAGESLPVDGQIVEGASSINYAILSGESRPVYLTVGANVHAGTQNLDSPIVIKVSQSGIKTRIGQILTSIDSILSSKAPIVEFTDKVAKYFVAAVVLLSILAFALGSAVNWHGGINRALAIAIVACPCTFALATPLALSLIIGKLSKVGILVKGADAIERMSKIDTIFFDKTGTITYGTPKVVAWHVPQEYNDLIYSVESLSSHPIAQAIIAYLSPIVSNARPTAIDFKEQLGFGVSAQVGKDKIQLHRNKSHTDKTEVVFLVNNVVKGQILFDDVIRHEATSAIRVLRQMGLQIKIISGDHFSAVQAIAARLGIDKENAFAEVGPEDKSKIVKTFSKSLMIGDGANDAMALASAYVSLAVRSSIEVSLRAADVFLREPALHVVAPLIVVSQETMRVINRNLVFALFYNFIAATAAIFGKIDPLFAALLMPASALTVYMSTIFGTKKMRLAIKDLQK
jgi:heavy metal translocating P-type ATPase